VVYGTICWYPSSIKNADAKELDDYTEELMTKHVSGRLKVAPEHTSDPVLKLMRKPSFTYFHKFKKTFDKINLKKKLNLQLIPYFISSHPACELEDMANLAAETKDMGFQLEQVQGFTPTPMTVATVIYYSGYHPYTLKKMYAPKSKKDKDEQHRFFFWYKKENKNWIKNTLQKVNRNDLIEKLLGTSIIDKRTGSYARNKRIKKYKKQGFVSALNNSPRKKNKYR